MEMTHTPSSRPSVQPAPGPGPAASSASVPLEEHAMLGDLYTAALVTQDGVVDFLCLPDFDSEGTFVSLLGNPSNGQWVLAPTSKVLEKTWAYRGNTLILETTYRTASGKVRVVDFMPAPRGKNPHLVRRVEGLEGEVEMQSVVTPRFSTGYTVPRQSRRDGAVSAVAGKDAVYLRYGEEGAGAAPFNTTGILHAGEQKTFVLSWGPTFEPIPVPLDVDAALAQTEKFWEEWAATIQLPREFQEIVKRSLLTLKACTFKPSGAIVAAPTFGLPETPGGARNWDYRFCWVRDSALTLNAFMAAGLMQEARAFGDWLQDSVGGAPQQLQIMYGIRGERRLSEVELPYLQGYGGARPVRVGNGAYNQFQLDVLGEFADVLFVAIQLQNYLGDRAHQALRAIADRVAKVWQETDHGIWEMRGEPQHFVASKVAAWVATDRYVRAIEEFKLADDPQPWRALRQRIFDEVCTKGYDAQRNTFTQYFGSTGLDASLLAIPLMGFLPPTDPRVIGTVAAIEQELMPDGLVLRYRTEEGTDGLSGEEGVFLPCSFWLANVYQMMGRNEDARRLFGRVVGLASGLGLLAEEYLVKEKRQTGNFPQAFSHLALVNSAYTLFGKERREDQR